MKSKMNCWACGEVNQIDTSDPWGDGDVVMVTVPSESGGVSTWIGRIVGGRMGEGGAKPHRIDGAVVQMILKNSSGEGEAE